MNYIKYTIILFLTLTSCSINREVNGNYRSNFASLGFFKTTIKLNIDSTAQYIFAGDMQHQELTGKFKVYKSTLYLRIDKDKNIKSIDTFLIEGLDEAYKKDSTIFKNIHSYDLKTENGISYHFKYKIKHKKLSVYNVVTGKIVRKNKFYGIKKKYIFFGPKAYKKRYFLMKTK